MLAATRVGLRTRAAGSLATQATTTSTTISPVMIMGRALFSTSDKRAATNRRVDQTLRRAQKMHLGKHQEHAPSVDRIKAMNTQIPAILLPETFVIPPLSRFPREFKPLMSYLWHMIRIKATDFILSRHTRYQSQPGWREKPLISLKKGPLIAQAKAMHRQMNETIACGDLDALERLVDTALYYPLATTIHQRPKGRTCKWELVRYNKEARVVSQKIMPIGDKLLWQVVVSIPSRQRLVEYERGKVVPGSEKELDLVENVVMSTVLNDKTWSTTGWKIIATVQPMTPEKWEHEKETVRMIGETQFKS
ncbi:hypothetical protein B0T20DRAFT_481100 [Sordaria brevicollis]|uniref:Tim44-like domain-containing protein n=1 Tax=Sordaria brevicollis TaxID=83679 RepID=A0AAE0PAC1_SORBR|nr:hypothetical protein B0T20DRAFT_481100 [Sordaria brevicollis]